MTFRDWENKVHLSISHMGKIINDSFSELDYEKYKIRVFIYPDDIELTDTEKIRNIMESVIWSDGGDFLLDEENCYIFNLSDAVKRAEKLYPDKLFLVYDIFGLNFINIDFMKGKRSSYVNKL